MRTFFYWVSRVFFAQIILFIPLYIWVMFVVKLSSPLGNVFIYPVTYGVIFELLAFPVAVIALLATTPTISKSIKIWKGVLWTSFALIALPFALVFNPSRAVAPGDPSGFALIPVVLFGVPLLVIGVAGLLIAEWIAKRRIGALNPGSNVVH